MAIRTADRHARVYHDLAVLLEAGLPILRAFDSVLAGTRGHMGQALRQIRQAIAKGLTISEAMQDHDALFAEFDRQIIAAAEASGRLDQCLRMLADWYDFRDRMRRRIVSGLWLPVVVWHVASAVIPLPGLILGGWNVLRYLTQVSGLLLVLYLPLTVLYCIYRFAPQRGTARLVLDRLLSWVPLLGKGLRELGLSRYCRTFSMLYKSGVPMIQALEQSVHAAGNLLVSRMVAHCPSSARSGEMASAGFSRRIPREYRELWSIGEESGELDRTVDKVAEIAEDRATLKLQAFSQWLPRLIYGFVAVMMLLAIFAQFAGILDSYNPSAY